MLVVLNKWIEDHIEYPYPNSDEFKALSDQTGLDEKQVRIWFTNTRKRRLRITREEFKFKQNTFIRNLIESQQQDSLNSAPVPTLDQAVQTDPVIKQEYERSTHRKSMRESSNYSQFWSADYFIKNIFFTAEVVDLNEMCLCDDSFVEYLAGLGFCTCSSL
ncbi:unnamed protein product [Moneuplotes crassus]|uniref:Homeobox domain-containing protein n=1 Tax=Euplotes crassus TaxID=5936 RepID=A0AAD1Y333_EUPCR|nr:unnamed protein product [Moneuplotes crassus]